MSDVSLTCILPGSPAPQDIFTTGGFLRLRQRGPWVAYLECSSKVAPAEMSPASVLVRREDGTIDTFTGTVRRAKANAGNEKLAVSVIAGAGRILLPLRPLDHVLGAHEVPAGLVARAIADDAGERLAPGVEQALDAILLPRWHRATDATGWAALDLLAHALGYPWRFLPSGEIWMGAETWPTVSPTAAGAYWMDLVEDDGAATYSVRGAPFLPGQSLDVGPAGAPDVRQLVDVRYAVTGSALTVAVRSAVAGDPSHVPDLDLYRGSYAATVKAQRSDGTLDLRADDARIGDILAVELRVGLPGCAVTVPVGARVRVRFDAASPKGAFAEGLDQDGAAEVPIALVGDLALRLWCVLGSGGIATLYVSGSTSAPYDWTGVPVSASLPLSTDPGTPIYIAGPGSRGVKLR